MLLIAGLLSAIYMPGSFPSDIALGNAGENEENFGVSRLEVIFRISRLFWHRKIFPTEGLSRS